MKRAVMVSILLCAIIVASGGFWFHRNLWGTRSSRAAEIEIAAGSTAHEILVELHGNDLLPSVLAGRIYLKMLASGKALYYGHYRFPPATRPADALEMILEGAVKMFAVTIVEGSDLRTISEQFSGLGLGSTEEWLEFGQRLEWISDFAANAPSLEGFLFPDTYSFAFGIPAERAAHHLVKRFEEVWGEETRKSGTLWGSTLDIVTLASLVEAETSLDEERPLVAGVFANRLRKGMLLQCDPTVVYALKRRNEWRGRLLRIHWEVDDPYNTYRYPGLPPGPINSPGRAALAAAINPQPTPFLYFVAKPGGGHTFSRTLSEHNRAVARLMSSRR